MDIGSDTGYPASVLSNFSPYPFTIDDVECASMEGFLQSIKFDKPNIQVEVCKLVGKVAKFRGKKRNKAWKRCQTLWWQGQAFPRKSREYQELLDRAFAALTKNTSFRKALLTTQEAVLTHSMGKNKKSETVLTEREFCSRLMSIRQKLREESQNV